MLAECEQWKHCDNPREAPILTGRKGIRRYKKTSESALVQQELGERKGRRG
jgi:hypothetical protein